MNILEEVGEHDFYHLPAYQRLNESRLNGTAVLPAFRSQGCAMAFPLLIRDIAIPGLMNGGYRDAACVPGYTGPVISANMTESAREGLIRQFHEFLRDNGLVSVYSRLHFLLGQEEFLSGHGETVDEGFEVTVDLTPPLEVQYSRYRRNQRRDLKKLSGRGVVFEEAGPEYLNAFMDLYYATMDRVGATSIYYNDKSYFEDLLQMGRKSVRLFVCRDRDTIVCALLVLLCNGHVHAYRVGILEEYRNLGISKLLYDELRIWATNAGAEVFHFGGGAVGGRDSLYNFKMGFGGREHVWRTWRFVADREADDDLCRRACALAGRMTDDDYFPEYRSPSLGLDQGA